MDFADSLEKKSNKENKRSEKRVKDPQKIPVSHVDGFFHPSNSHHKPYRPELDFLSRVIKPYRIRFQHEVHESESEEQEARYFSFSLPHFEAVSYPMDSKITVGAGAPHPTIRIDIYPIRRLYQHELSTVFERIIPLKERKLTTLDELHIGEKEPMSIRKQRDGYKPHKVKPEYVQSEWLHPNGARALLKDRFEVALKDIWLSTSLRIWKRRMVAHQMWWRILIETEPSNQVGGEATDTTHVCTSVRARAYILEDCEHVPSFEAEGIFAQNRPSEMKGEEEEASLGKIEQIHKRHAEKKEIKQERKWNEKQMTVAKERTKRGHDREID